MSLLETADASGTPHLFSSAGNVCDICMINEYFIETICTDGWYRPKILSVEINIANSPPSKCEIKFPAY